MNNIEHRSFFCDVRAENTDSNEKIIVGQPIVYNSRTNIGYFDEIIKSGALDKTNLKDVRFLVNHDISKIPLARSRNNNKNSTMQLNLNEKGLEVVVRLDTENNSESRALYSAVQRGDISGMSFMFTVDKNGDDWEDRESEHPTRIIRSIRDLVEVSACTFPAYKDTSINARGLNNEVLESARSILDNMRSETKKTLDSDYDLKLAKAKFDFKYETEV